MCVEKEPRTRGDGLRILQAWGSLSLHAQPNMNHPTPNLQPSIRSGRLAESGCRVHRHTLGSIPRDFCVFHSHWGWSLRDSGAWGSAPQAVQHVLEALNRSHPNHAAFGQAHRSPTLHLHPVPHPQASPPPCTAERVRCGGVQMASGTTSFNAGNLCRGLPECQLVVGPSNLLMFRPHCS